MLTGLIPPTSGDAWIGTHSIRSGMRQIRSSLGVCPQQNVLFTPMTPTEHLELHGELKGIYGAELDKQIVALLELVGLKERARVPSSALSGGQKRKLCLAIALLGSPGTCFLDEPTSGMDPHSRRAIWGLLREQREGRTLVLTTHFLDEAEILSDRIAIMAEGALRCVGSPLFLKSRLGCGYRLTLSKRATGFSADGILTFLKTYEPNAELTVDERLFAELNLPSGSIDAFSSLFAALDRSLDTLGVAEYGLTCTTLEDVFLRINANNLDRLDKLRNRSHIAATPQQTRRRTTGTDKSGEQGEASAATAAAAAPLPVGEGSGEGGDESGLGAVSGADDALAAAAPRPTVRMRGGSTLVQLCALVTKRRLQAQRDVCATCCQLLFPVLLVLLALLLLSWNVQDTGPRLPLSPNFAFQDTPPPPGGSHRLLVPHTAGGGNQTAWSAATQRGLLTSAAGGGREVTSNLTEWLVAEGWALEDDSLTDGLSDGFPAFASELSTRLLSRFWSNGSASHDTVPPAALTLSYSPPVKLPPPLPSLPEIEVPTMLFQSKQVHALPTLLASLYDARLRQASGGASTISAATHPLPRTRVEQAELSIALSAFASILILVPFAFVAASFVTPHVRERETGSKQMQYVSGVGSVTYWVASWIWDALLYTAVLVCTLAVFKILNRHEFTADGNLYATAALLAAFGAAAIGVASVASFAFTTPSAGLILMIAFHFISGFGLVIADTIFLIIGGSAYDTDRTLADWVYPLFPAYCLGRGFLTLTTRSLLTQVPFGPHFHHEAPPLYQWDQLGSPLTFLVCEAAATYVLTLLMQLVASRPALFQGLWRALCGGAEPDAEAAAGPDSDDSVEAERAGVDEMPASFSAYMPLETSTELVLRHLRKRYGRGSAGKLAVRDLCLRVHAGECFGFLGVNGAGKSTTFAMLTGAISPTSGDATLRGLSILSQQDDLRKLVGFCPQHDALEALLTPRETLTLYARIKGVPSRHVEEEVEGLLRDLDLVMFASKKAGTLSGGNKRKLCVAVALIGSPQLVLLDEPSSGMDAASKRFLWAVIKRRTAEACTILTSHSMEECEALCSRVGVMVDGAFRCVGPIQTLKSRYGQGYKLDLRLAQAAGAPSAEEVTRLVAEGCPGAKLEEAEPPCLTLTLPRTTASLSAIFAHLALVRERCGVLECSLSQCTLEQVFLLMASKQALREGSEE